MTNEAAIARLEEHKATMDKFVKPTMDMNNSIVTLVRAEEMAIAALREQDQNRWIPVTERLPEDYAIVQIVEDNGFAWMPHIGEYRHGLGKWRIPGCFEETNDWLEDIQMFHVTHWMPLPKPPTGIQQ